MFASDTDHWVERVRPITGLPESLSASVALARLRDAETELALVLDEYGGTAGILTVSDILDEIAERETSLERGVLPGSTALHLLTGLAGLDLEETDAATIGGYVTGRLGRLPESGERIPAGGWDIVVERATDHRVVSTRLVRRGSDE